VHVQIIANIALKLLRLLVGHGIQPSIVAQHALARTTTPRLVVVLAALLHDVGMAIHRDDHERFSLILATLKCANCWTAVYDLRRARTVMAGPSAHAISRIAPTAGADAEAGRFVRVARRAGHGQGPLTHRVRGWPGQTSTRSRGGDRPYRDPSRASTTSADRRRDAQLRRRLQLDALLKEKLSGSGLEPYVEVIATIQGEPRRS